MATMVLTPPTFVSADADVIIEELVAQYESLTGKTLQPAQPERLLLNQIAYREAILRTIINESALLMLVSFSRAPILDYLGRLVGVTRLAASNSTVTLRFTLVSGHTGVTIPKGTRVQSGDGKFIWATTSLKVVTAGTLTADVQAECTTAGAGSNGYVAGQVNIILDPQAFITTAVNYTVPGGGSDEETDDELRERIQLAPASFSTAGSRGAYRYHALSAHPAIIDVTILGPQIGPPLINAGQVKIYVLAEGGTTPEIVSAVNAACNDEQVRPLTDAVEVVAAEGVDYLITVELTIYDQSVEADIISAVTANIEALRATKSRTLGDNLTKTQIIAQCMVPGVYDASVELDLDEPDNPADVVEVNVTQYANQIGLSVSVVGTTNG